MSLLTPKTEKVAGQSLNTIKVLGVPVHSIVDVDILSLCHQWMNDEGVHQIITANPLLLLECQNNRLLLQACETASLVINDSTGIEWASKKLKLPDLGRFPGIDFSYQLLKLCAKMGKSVYFLGGNLGVPEMTAKKLEAEIPGLKVVGTHHGYFTAQEKESILRNIHLLKPSLVLVGLGMPRQDVWIYEHLKKLSPAIYIGIGGCFDVWSGKLKRAPKWMQIYGFEWIFRLFQEPSRFLRMIKLPFFVLRVLKQSFF
ncbi:MAG: WecB/TagA/CpsF family glycosyltransferase [Elusimicrobiota bacterium]